MNTVIAIDGPSASGKSTLARNLAAKIGFVYVDTGAMYRGYTWKTLQSGIDPYSREDVASLIDKVEFKTSVVDGKIVLSLDGEDPEPHIRNGEINHAVSKVASVPELREFLVNQQRELRGDNLIVMEGRDIGTVVCTDTRFKFYVDANEEVRAARRSAQGQADNTAARDAQDRNRKVAPLTMAADAVYIDNSVGSIEENVGQMIDACRERGLDV